MSNNKSPLGEMSTDCILKLKDNIPATQRTLFVLLATAFQNMVSESNGIMECSGFSPGQVEPSSIILLYDLLFYLNELE